MSSSNVIYRTLYDLVSYNAMHRPAREALISDGRRWTYSELERGTRRLSAVLAERGVQPGAKVLVMAPSSDAFVVSFFALIRLGAVPVPVPPGLREVEVIAHARSVQATLLLADASVDEALRETFIRAVTGRVMRLDARRQQIQWQTVEGMEPPVPYFDIRYVDVPAPWPATPSDLAVILHTSGSAGRPRGVSLTHANLLDNAEAIGSVLPLELHPTTAVILPLHHASALSGQLIAGMRVGGTMHLFRNLAFAVPVLHEIQREATESLVATPAIFRRLAELAACEEVDLGCVRHVSCVGAPLSSADAERISALFPGAMLYHHYGLTEAGPRVSTISLRDPRFGQGSAGKPIEGVSVRIAHEGNVVRPFEIGEVWVQGPGVSSGYWGEPPRNQSWLATGDLGYVDEDGYLYVQGRREEILSGGVEKFSPSELEHVLERHPAIREAAAVGVMDPRHGERVVAWVVLISEVAPLDLLRHCERFLAKYKCPQVIKVIEHLPRTVNGKVMRELLRDWAIAGGPPHPEPLSPPGA